MSIIIIGVGDADFSNMKELDSDGGYLQDSEGNTASRDLVQFVEFNKYKDDLTLLHEDVLREVPKQFMEYMTDNGIKPNLKGHKDVDSVI
jgi:hypothetical protein